MCMCGQPTINGQPGYSWNGEAKHVYHVNPPDLADGDELLYDEPGRCGGTDSHSHHLRVVKARYGGFSILVRHGGGDERLDLGYSRKGIREALAALDSNGRYWLLIGMYHVIKDATQRGVDKCNATWRAAAAEKRIKTRKVRAGVKVWVEPPVSTGGTST